MCVHSSVNTGIILFCNSVRVYNEVLKWCIVWFKQWSLQRKDGISECACVFDIIAQHFDLFTAPSELSTHPQHLRSACADQRRRHHDRCPLLSARHCTGISFIFYCRATSNTVLRVSISIESYHKILQCWVYHWDFEILWCFLFSSMLLNEILDCLSLSLS